MTVSRAGYPQLPTEQAASWILATTLIACALLATVGGGVGPLTLPLAEPSALVLLAFTGILAAGIPTVLFLTGIRAIGGTRTGILMLFEPVVGVALAALVLDESLRPIQALGGVAILAAALLLQRAPAGTLATGRNPLHFRAPSSDDGNRRFRAGTDRTDGGAVTESGPIRVVLVDDHGVVRRGLRGYLELLDDIEVVGEAENGLLGVELVDQVTPDVVLMDIVMPQLDGIGAITQIKAAHPEVQVVAAHELHRGGEGHGRPRGRRERVHPQGRRRGRRRRRDPGRLQRRGPPRPGRRAHPGPAACETRSTQPATEPLTERELEVLALVGRGRQQQGDRDGPRHHRADGPDARQQHPRQARPGEPDAGGPLRGRTKARPRPRLTCAASAGPSVDDRPPIVFLHATRLTGAQWARQVADLSDEFRCLTPDLPGHGTAADVPFTLDGAADRVAALIERDAGGRAIVVGLSLGAYVAMDLAARRPELVAGLVLAGATVEPRGLRSLLTGPWPRSMGSSRARPGSGAGVVFRTRYPVATSAPILADGFWFRGGADGVRALIGESFRPRLARYPGPDASDQRPARRPVPAVGAVVRCGRDRRAAAHDPRRRPPLEPRPAGGVLGGGAVVRPGGPAANG